jgi:phosphoglucomutase
MGRPLHANRRGNPMTTRFNPLAGKPAPLSSLIDVAKLVTAYFEVRPDPAIAAQRVAFGTSGNRGSSFDGAFNEGHVLAISQAICDYRCAHDISGPLFLGIDTHALSEPACASGIEVLAANGVNVMLATNDEYTPTPAISHAILTYNPPTGGPADQQITASIPRMEPPR